MGTNSSDQSATPLLQQEGYDFITAVFEVHNEMGSGFFEKVYHESLELEFTARGIPFVSKPSLPVYCEGQLLKKQYYADLVVVGELLVELEAVRTLAPDSEGSASQLPESHAQTRRLPRERRVVSPSRVETDDRLTSLVFISVH